jgi:hypothetical protein
MMKHLDIDRVFARLRGRTVRRAGGPPRMGNNSYVWNFKAELFSGGGAKR